MSRRTAEASRAVALAWANEQQRVMEGKGIRDWTPEQQKDILERGKAYDDKGRAFEGQHMKSVEKYPEYQSDPDNIQFLTKEEHLEAHQGSWKNPTNWYYDPVTKEITDFGDEKYIPCAIIDLSEPISTASIQSPEAHEKEPVLNNNNRTESSFSENRTDKYNNIKKTTEPVKSRKSLFDKIVDGVFDFASKHPKLAVFAFESAKVVLAMSSDDDESDDLEDEDFEYDEYSLDDDLNDTLDNECIIEDELYEESNSEEKAPQTKRPHYTRGYTRIRNGKEEKVRGYSTGKNREQSEDDF